MRTGRRGFTLVEVMVAAVVAAVVFGAVWFVFAGGQQSYTKGTDLTEAMQGALLLCDRFEADCMQVAAPRDAAAEPVRVTNGGSALALQVATTERLDHDGRGLRELTWQVDGRRMVRDGKKLKDVFVREAAFRFFPVAAGAPTTGAPTAGDGAAGDEAMQFVRVEGETTDRFGRSSFPFVRLVALTIPSRLGPPDETGGGS